MAISPEFVPLVIEHWTQRVEAATHRLSRAGLAMQAQRPGTARYQLLEKETLVAMEALRDVFREMTAEFAGLRRAVAQPPMAASIH